MDGYLVPLCGTDDDFPLSLHVTREEAHAFHRRVLVNPKQALGCSLDFEVDDLRARLDLDRQQLVISFRWGRYWCRRGW
jgi:hypothetical protein